MVDPGETQGSFLTPVNVASALFFETPAEIFAGYIVRSVRVRPCRTSA